VRQQLLIGALIAVSLAITATGVASRTVPAYPDSLVVIGGDSVAQGHGSDPGHPYRDTPANSWATGTNSAVQSIYTRILAANPAIRGHAFNLVADGATVSDLPPQIAKAERLTPKPGLVLVEIDGDIECDGKDTSRIADFRMQLGTALGTLATGLPTARIFVVSTWGSFPSYVTYLKGLSLDARLKHAGKSLCQLVAAPSGLVVPSHVAYAQKTVFAYDAALAAACAATPRCRYDGGAAQRLTTTAADITLDQENLSIQGESKLAATEWAAMAGFLSGKS